MTDHAFHEDDYKSRFDWPLWRRVLRHALPFRRTLAELATLGLVFAGFEIMLPLLTGRLIDTAIERGPSRELAVIAALYVVLFTVMCLCIWRFILLAGRVATGLGHDLRAKAFAHLQHLPFSYYDRRPVGWLMARLTSDCSRLSNLVGWLTLDACWGFTLILGISIVMMILNWQLALLVLVMLPPLVLVSLWFQKRLLATSRATRKANSQLTAGFNEAIMGVRTTKTLVREAQNLDEFQSLSSEMYRHSMRNALYSAVYLPLILTIGALGVGFALWGGGTVVARDGMTIGTLIAFMQFAALLFHPIEELARRFTDVQVAQASAERIQGLLDTPLEIEDSAEVKAAMKLQREAASGDLAPDGYANRIDTIEFRAVSFAYKRGQRVLDEFNLRVEAGQTIALVGPTGGGKSTIVSLVCRFYEPSAGEILINGVDYRRRSLLWLQSNLGIVQQQPHLFSGTIRENIRYGRLDATDAEIESAARLVNANGFIVGMDKGYDSDVGEGGNRLSTGQKQLISLARAVLADPQIFVMDEATSSVDTHTEKLIQDGIEKVLRGRTSFVIAHRLSTIRNADRILVIDGGRIVEQGNHHELINLRRRYFELYTNQFTRASEEAILQGK